MYYIYVLYVLYILYISCMIYTYVYTNFNMFIYYTYMVVNQSYGTIANEESDAWRFPTGNRQILQK